MPKRKNPENPEAKDGLNVDVLVLKAEDLDDRQGRGLLAFREAEKSNARAVPVTETETWWKTKKGSRVYSVFREFRNRGGKNAFEYRCTCGDYTKMGRIDCEHIFAEKCRRVEVIVEGRLTERRKKQVSEGRRPARKRIGAEGLTVKTHQKHARMELGTRLPELVRDLKRAIDRRSMKFSRRDRNATSRAIALVFKVVFGMSAEEMMPVFERLIQDGVLRLKRVPHPNTLSRWVNDPRLTPILLEMLRSTAAVFRAMEIACIIDSSKMSQMRTAHARMVEYEDDVRDDADWMKMHALVGVETMCCMAVAFSGTRGAGVHDSKFVFMLLEQAKGLFDLRYLLADKAYLSEDIVGKLWEMGMKAVIPIKKRIDLKNRKRFYEAYEHLATWFDKRQKELHEVYRLRPKIEAFFSLVKRMADGYCWSRGRPNKDAAGNAVGNSVDPCVAWVNESICKLIYVNMRLTVEHEHITGYRMNHLADTFFPAIPAEDKLVA